MSLKNILQKHRSEKTENILQKVFSIKQERFTKISIYFKMLANKHSK